MFKVDPRPDGGQFADGDSAALAWDVLQQTGRHRITDVIDLSGCVHLKPYALACLCALGELGRHNGRPITLIEPGHEDCKSHLARLGVPSFFDGDWESMEPRESNLQIRRVEWPPGPTATEIVDLLAPRQDLPAGVYPEMVESLDEVITNALTHAESPVDCLVAGQAFPETKKVEIAVLDLGQTIRGHLTKHPDLHGIVDDEHAIKLAMQDGITGTPPGEKNVRGEDNSGAGLANLKAYCEAGGGEFTILSGDRWITCQPDSEPVSGTLYGGFRGCLVNIRYSAGIELPERGAEPIL